MIRFFNGRTLTMADGVSVTTDEVWTDGDKIAYIGPTPETLPAFERQIDLGGDLVMPGFKNAHAHAGMSFVRSYADDVPLQPWLFEQIFPLEAKLTPEAVYAFTKLSILEYLTSGITAGFDMYYFREAIAQASIDCGFRTVLCGGGGSAQQLESEYRKFNALHPLISYQLGLHSEYTSNLTEMTEAGELARALHAPVFAHNAETAREVAECRGRWGKTPTELFDSLGHFDYGGGGFHCVHMTEHDLEIFRNRGLWAVTNPGSNAKLASGIAPLKQMRALGIHMAIGTDGPSSNNALDFFREMYLAAVLQKLRCGDAAALPADDVLYMATVGGAQAMGLTDCDVLAPGKQADLIVINHGANDYAATPERYAAAYTELLDAVRARSPLATVFAVSAFRGTHREALAELIPEYNRTRGCRVHFVDTAGWIPPEPLHPHRNGHKTVADRLAPIIREVIRKGR